jgi:hypothetical protein
MCSDQPILSAYFLGAASPNIYDLGSANILDVTCPVIYVFAWCNIQTLNPGIPQIDQILAW